MKSTLIMTRPSALPAVCAPVSAVPSDILASTPLRDLIAGQWVAGPVTVDTPSLSRQHQVRIQAELAQDMARGGESYGITGSTVKGSLRTAKKRFVNVARGVPPRGRPV